MNSERFVLLMVVSMALITWHLMISIVIITSGFFYYVSMVLAGDTMYGDFPIYSYSTSLFNHGTLIIYSLIVAKDIKFKSKEIHIIHIGLLLTMIYALLMRPIITHPGRIFIYMILDAELVKAYFLNIKHIMYPVYYILFGLYLYFSGYVVFLLNKILLIIQPGFVGQ